MLRRARVRVSRTSAGARVGWPHDPGNLAAAGGGPLQSERAVASAVEAFSGILVYVADEWESQSRLSWWWAGWLMWLTTQDRRRWRVVPRRVSRWAKVTLLAAAVDGHPAVHHLLWNAGLRGQCLSSGWWMWMVDRKYHHLVGWVDVAAVKGVSRLLLNPDGEPNGNVRAGLPAAAVLADHPVGAAARRAILASDDASLVEDVCSLAIADAGLASFCRDHGLAPAEPTRRAWFLLLTGQMAELRELDPDNTLLARAYNDIGYHQERMRVRIALVEHGRLDLLIHLVATRPKDLREALRGPELDRITTSPAITEHPAALWDMVAASAPADAVRLVRLFEDGWRPDDSRLFDRLRATDPDQAAAVAADPWTTYTVHGSAAAFDGSRIAVFTGPYSSDGPLLLRFHTLRSGAPLFERTYPPEAHPYEAAFCHGDVVLATAGRELWRHTPDDSVQVTDFPVHHLTSLGDGWAAVTDTDLLIGTLDGRILRRVTLAKLGLPPSNFGLSGRVSAVVATRDGSRLAVAANGRIAVVERTGRILVTGRARNGIALKGPLAKDRRLDTLSFFGRDVLLTVHPRPSLTTRTVPNGRTADGRTKWKEETVDAVTTDWLLARWAIAEDGGATLASHLPAWDRMVGPRPKTQGWFPNQVVTETVSVHEVPAYPGVMLMIGPNLGPLPARGEWPPLRGEFKDLDTGCPAGPPIPEPIIPIPSELHPPQVWLSEDTPHVVTFEPGNDGTVRVSDLRRGHLLSALGRTYSEQDPNLLGQLTAALPEYPDDPWLHLVHTYLEHHARRT